MKTLLILGAGKEQVAAIAAAKAKGIRTVVLDMNPKAEGRILADEFHLVSTRDRYAILSFAKSYPSTIDGVMTIASDITYGGRQGGGWRAPYSAPWPNCVSTSFMKQRCAVECSPVCQLTCWTSRLFACRVSVVTSRWTIPPPAACSG
jgi:hypothetical protein